MKNRIAVLIDAYEQRFAKLDRVEQEELSRSLDLTPFEHALFQEKKSLAQLEGRLSLEEATTIYQLLGGVASVFNSQSLAVKSVLTQVFAALLNR